MQQKSTTSRRYPMSITVMIVDDSLFMRKMLRDILEEEGYEVVAEASDGVEAVEKYRETNPDLTTLDIVMPNKTGIEALQEIIAFDPDARIVMCSASGQESLTVAAAEGGAKAFILKPFNPELVARVLKEACEN
jgi:two-component system, chemotaxis family, chemotaxis protein CheY